MSINQSVFPSKKERDAFEHLKGRWGNDYHLYSNLPFLQVLNTNDLIDLSGMNDVKYQVSKADLQRLKKTSIDYTLCDKNDKPLLSIEFDGINKGFNVGIEYKAKKVTNEWRKLIIELKLKIAMSSNYPFFVLSGFQFVDLDKTEKLAIVDCIIGSVLAYKEMHHRFEGGFDPKVYGYTQSEFDNLSSIEQNSIIEDWGIGIEVESNFNNNPLFNLVYALEQELDIKRMGFGNVAPADLVGVDDQIFRQKIIDKIDQVGATAWVEIEENCRIYGTVWVPNYKSSGYSHYSYIYELATYIALLKAKKIRLRRAAKKTHEPNLTIAST